MVTEDHSEEDAEAVKSNGGESQYNQRNQNNMRNVVTSQKYCTRPELHPHHCDDFDLTSIEVVSVRWSPELHPCRYDDFDHIGLLSTGCRTHPELHQYHCNDFGVVGGRALGGPPPPNYINIIVIISTCPQTADMAALLPNYINLIVMISTRNADMYLHHHSVPELHQSHCDDFDMVMSYRPYP